MPGNWRIDPLTAERSCEARPGISESMSLRRGFARRGGGNASGSALELGVAEPLAQLAHGAELDGQVVVELVGTGQDVLEGEVAQLDSGVLHREEVLDLVVEALPDHPSAVRERRVQQRGHEPVALVEVGLPVERVVLVRPRDVPDRDTGHRDRGVAGRLGADAVLGVVPLDEQRRLRPISRTTSVGSGT